MKIDRLLLESTLGIKVSVFEKIDSTSLYLKRLILEGSSVPDLVIAYTQTNGQGRTGKTFYSPHSSGLYATFVFSSSTLNCDDVTPRVALATARSVDAVFSCQTGVKWVNDIYHDGRKVSGILCQKINDYILVGIGINVEQPNSVPADLLDRFGALTQNCPSSKYNELVVSLYRNLLCSLVEPQKSILFEYKERCIHIGKEVCILNDGNELKGVCTGIEDDFSLIVSVDGELRRFTSGYMTLKI